MTEISDPCGSQMRLPTVWGLGVTPHRVLRLQAPHERECDRLQESKGRHGPAPVNNRRARTLDRFGFPPSDHNRVHHNNFSQSLEDVRFANANMGSDNWVYQNTTLGSCA